ncbi:ATP-binding cassette domain-containing protein [Streptacidiphilus monticola]
MTTGKTYKPFQAIGLTKSYRKGRPPALLDLSFDARPGEVTVLLGPEGSGRTTALRLALGLEQGRAPHSSTAACTAASPGPRSPWAWSSTSPAAALIPAAAPAPTCG